MHCPRRRRRSSPWYSRKWVKDPGSVFNPEPDLHGDLKLAELSVNNRSANLGDLKPIEVSNRSGRSFESVANSLVD